MTNEQLEEAVASLNELHATANITEMYLIIRQLWEEREQKRAVMARAKAAIDGLRGTIDRDGIGAWSSRSPQAIAAMQAIAALESMEV